MGIIKILLLLLLVGIGMLWRLLFPGPEKENVCMLCEEYTSKALDYIGANKTEQAIIEMLDKSCSYVPSYKEKCTSMVNYYGPLFYEELSSVQPEKFCRKVCLCEQMEFVSSMIWDDNCEFCHGAASVVIENIKDPDKMDIIQMLSKACDLMERKFAKKCKGLVFDYGRLVLAIAEKFLETVDICIVFDACIFPAAKIGETVATKGVPALSDF